MKVILVVFDRKALELSEQLVGGIEQYIDEHSAHLLREAEYGGDYAINIRRRETARLEEALPDISGKSLDEVLGGAG